MTGIDPLKDIPGVEEFQELRVILLAVVSNHFAHRMRNMYLIRKYNKAL